MEPTKENIDVTGTPAEGKPGEKPLTLDQRLFQAAEFLYGASKMIEGIEDLEATRQDILVKSEALLNYLEDTMVNVTTDDLDSIINEIKG